MKASQTHVLIVTEDSQLNREIVEVMPSLQVDVTIVPNLASALEELGQHPGDGLVFDMELMDEETFLDLIPLRQRWPLLPLILLCGRVTFFHFPEILSPFTVLYKYGAQHSFPKCFFDLLQFVGHQKGQTPKKPRRNKAELSQMISRLYSILTSETQRHALILQELASLTGARGGSLFLFEQGALVLKACLDPGHAPDSISMPLKSHSAFAQTAEAKRPLLLHAQTERNLQQSGWQGYKDGSMMVFPIMDQHSHIHCLISLHNGLKPFNARDFQAGSQLLQLISRFLYPPETAQLPF